MRKQMQLTQCRKWLIVVAERCGMKTIERVFWGAELLLYLAFVSADLFRVPWGTYSNELKYIALGICLVYALVLYNRKRHAGSGAGWSVGILAAAMCADYFLLFTEQFVAGILLFAVVQGCYRMRFLGMSGRERDCAKSVIRMYLLGLALALTVAFICSICLGLPADSDLLTTCTAVFYACCLVQNVILGIRLSAQARGGRSLHVLTAAILLLLLCDIHVGICNLDGVALFSGYLNAAGVLMWVFYLPSQLCVVLSIGKNTEIEANFGN